MKLCPCCGLPTHGNGGDYEICIVCWWQDDGQDDATADEVWEGPNGKYSLSAARANFAAHGHMYDKGNGIGVVEHCTPERIALLDYARPVAAGKQPLDVARLRVLMEQDEKARDSDD